MPAYAGMTTSTISDFATKVLKGKEYIPKIFQEADLILSGERSQCTKTYMRTRIHAKIKNGFLKDEG